MQYAGDGLIASVENTLQVHNAGQGVGVDDRRHIGGARDDALDGEGGEGVDGASLRPYPDRVVVKVQVAVRHVPVGVWVMTSFLAICLEA
mgnify:CR=1 FL=1